MRGQKEEGAKKMIIEGKNKERQIKTEGRRAVNTFIECKKWEVELAREREQQHMSWRRNTAIRK